MAGPLADATINTIDVNLVGDELKTDAQGQVAFTPPASGVYSAYTQFVDAKAGEKDGQALRRRFASFATLSFTWPLERVGADEEAVGLFTGRSSGSRPNGKTSPVSKRSWKEDVDGRADQRHGHGGGRRQR